MIVMLFVSGHAAADRHCGKSHHWTQHWSAAIGITRARGPAASGDKGQAHADSRFLAGHLVELATCRFAVRRRGAEQRRRYDS
jgi:hypothetical protein